MKKGKSLLVLIAVAALLWGWNHFAPSASDGARESVAETRSPTLAGNVSRADLPTEALQTLARIASDGPFPYRQDDTVFGNREGLLPDRPSGYYHEYTVETPGLDHRGARRIVTGGDPPQVYFYTADHYRSFRRIEFNP